MAGKADLLRERYEQFSLGDLENALCRLQILTDTFQVAQLLGRA
jgi:hypothetical protein